MGNDRAILRYLERRITIFKCIGSNFALFKRNASNSIFVRLSAISLCSVIILYTALQRAIQLSYVNSIIIIFTSRNINNTALVFITTN